VTTILGGKGVRRRNGRRSKRRSKRRKRRNGRRRRKGSGKNTEGNHPNRAMAIKEVDIPYHQSSIITASFHPSSPP